MKEDKTLIALTKVQIIVGVIMAVLVPTATSVGANYKAHTDILNQLQEHALENYKVFVPKDELKEVRIKLDQIDGKLNRIEGYLSRGKSR